MSYRSRPPTPRALLRGSALAAAVLLAPLLLVPTASAATTLPCDTLRPYRDLNGDGYEDAVVDDPYATVSGRAEAGTVTVLFGDSEGRIGEGARRTLTQADVGETPEAGDHFGWALALNRTSSGGCYGIVIGSPGEDVGSLDGAGMAHTLTFNGGGEGNPTDTIASSFDQGAMGGTPEAGDEFGYSVAARGGSNENNVVFAVGAPGENSDAGVVNYTDSFGPGDGVQDRQGSRGVPGVFQAGDRFGEVIDFFNLLYPSSDEYFFLWVGAPGDTVNGKAAAGSVTAVGSFDTSRVFTQDSPGVPGKVEAGDRFGASLAESQQPGIPNPRTVVIGAPGEDVGTKKDAGSVTVLKRNGKTFSPLSTIVLTQDTEGMAGTVEAGDEFGAAVAYRDDRTLAIGIPGEDLGTVEDAGSVQIVRVGTSNLSFPSPSITESSPGTPGVVKAGSRFGASVAGLPSTDVIYIHNPPAYGEGVFAISSLHQGGGSVYVVSDAPGQAPRAWVSGEDGIGVGRLFGYAVR